MPRFTVTAIIALFEGSAAEVALTYRTLLVSFAEIESLPLLLMLVPFPTDPVASGFEPTLHVTRLFVLPVTVAVNCKGLPTATVGLAGLIETVITGAGGGVGVGVGAGVGVGVGVGAGLPP